MHGGCFLDFFHPGHKKLNLSMTHDHSANSVSCVQLGLMPKSNHSPRLLDEKSKTYVRQIWGFDAMVVTQIWKIEMAKTFLLSQNHHYPVSR